jgi:hypothetical protein
VPVLGYAVALVSSLLLAIHAIMQYREQKVFSKLLIQLACITVYVVGILYFFGPRRELAAKGGDEDQRFMAAVIVLYGCVLFGMVAESLYFWFGRTPAQRRAKFDWGTIIKPLVISPIVLIPTVAAFQNANVDLTKLGFPWLMIMLTAFEKGFLWKHIFAKTTAEAVAMGRGRTNG